MRNPAPIHSSKLSLVTLSPATMITRLHRPAPIQSCASDTACVVLAQAEFSCVLGPRAPMCSANCECPIARMRNRNRLSKLKGSLASAAASPSRLYRSSARTPSGALGPSRSSIAVIIAICSRRATLRWYRVMSPASASSPGNADANTIPVSSRIASGSPHRSGSFVPFDVVL